jgi:solute carrier family 35, member E1
MIASVRLSPAPVAFGGSSLRLKSASVPSVSSLKPSKYVVSSFRPLYLSPLDGPRPAELKPRRQLLEFSCAASAADDKESKAEAVPVRSEAAQRVKISIYFATWWALNVIFNIYNKKVLNAFPYPWLTSTLSLACGSAMMLFSWATRLVEAPKTDLEFWKVLFPVSSTSFFWSLIIFIGLKGSFVVIVVIIFNCIILETELVSLMDEGRCCAHNWACCCDCKHV